MDIYVPAKRVKKIAYSYEQAQAASGLSVSTLKRNIKANELATVVVGGRTMIPRDALEHFVLRRRSRAGDAA
jgi:hypothetical protein